MTRFRLAACVAVGQFCASVALASPTFQLVGNAASSISIAYKLNYDGSTLVGTNYNTSTRDYWNMMWQSGVRTDLQTRGLLQSVSADGVYCVGDSAVPIVPAGNAFRFSLGGGYHDLRRPSGTGGTNVGTGLSADGSVVVGYFNDSGRSQSTSYRWSAAGGMVNIGHINGASTGYTRVYDTSNDGNTLVGESSPGSVFSVQQPVVWTATRGVEALPYPADVPPGRLDYGSAKAISGDGRVIVGYVTATAVSSGTVWVDRVPHRMTSAPGTFVVSADDVNEDGSVIVGDLADVANGNINYPFVYTPATGVVAARQFLLDHGISFPASAIVTVKCVSGDGLTFAGIYRDVANGIGTQSFVATIPSPSVALPGLMFALTLRRRGERAARLVVSRGQPRRG